MTPTILDHLPDQLLATRATEIHRHLEGPTLIHLPGQNTQPLVVSVLQHGNETSGWEATRRLLKGRYQRDPLPRSLILYIGNPLAAKDHVRHLDTQPDLNRCWPGSAAHTTPWHQLMQSITDHIKRCQPFASIDIHNNTGKNPHYAAVNHIDPGHLWLACEFSKSVIYFTEPKGVQSAAFGQFCPAVTLECGLSSTDDGADHALAYLERMLQIQDWPSGFPPPNRLELFQTKATVKVHPSAQFKLSSHKDASARHVDLVFDEDLDRYNFEELPVGFTIAHRSSDHPMPLVAHGHFGNDVSAECFSYHTDSIAIKQPVMPAMMTSDPFAIRHDCLCYLMERVSITDLQSGAVHEGPGMELPEAEAHLNP